MTEKSKNSATKKTRRCVGIDPAYAKDVAFAHRVENAWRVQSVEPDDNAALRQALQNAVDDGCEVVVIEDCFLGANPATFKGLAQMQERLKMYAHDLGLEIHVVAPSTWQAACLTQGKYKPKRHNEIVASAKLRARGMTGHDLKEDIAVAVCIADYGDQHFAKIETP